MDADVAKSAAAIFVLHMEHAPTGHAATANAVELGKIDVAQHLFVNQLLGGQKVMPETHALVGKKLPPGLAGLVVHRDSVPVAQRQRLFADDMRAGAQRLDRHLLVEQVGCADRDDVRPELREHRVWIGAVPGDPIAPGRLFGRLRPDVADTDDLRLVLQVAPGRYVGAIGDHAGSDQGDAPLLIVHILLHSLSDAISFLTCP